jgi:O-Antigen ligase
MAYELKVVIVTLVLGALTFVVGRPVALQFMDGGDFRRRRNIWLALTAAAFLCSSFWLFVLIAAPTLYWGGRKDTNPIAFYLFLMNVIPAVSVEIPTAGLGINELFAVDIFTLLSLCVLVPTALRMRKEEGHDGRLRLMDWLLLGFGLLQVVLFVPPDLPSHVILHNSFTGALRTAFLFFVTAFLLYYVASRSMTSRAKLTDAMAAFCLACTVMAVTAAFEALKRWPLYTVLYSKWDPADLLDQFLTRGGLLRAEASAGHPLALGYLLAVGLGFWLFLQSDLKSRTHRLLVPAVLCAGLIVTFSRGPWIGAIIIYVLYVVLSKRRASEVLGAAAGLVAVLVVIGLGPLGDHIANMLPFLGGHVGEGSLTYRELLVARCWQLIATHPLFGDQLAYLHMQDLRQGQGIIDIVNTYLFVALFYGAAGLTLFLGFILLGLRAAWRARAVWRPSDPAASRMASSLIAVMVGTLFMLLDCSFRLGYVPMFYTLAGLATAAAALARADRARASGSPAETEPIGRDDSIAV